jgi:hypothetical protein
VDEGTGDEAPKLTVVTSVRCLECGAVYAKPSGGGTVRENPGCPECGYVGWAVIGGSQLTEEWTPHHFASGRQPNHSG